MTKLTLISVVLGMASGYLFIPDYFINEIAGDLLVVGLCILLFFVGLDLGKQGTVVENMKKVGLGILAFPVASMIGCLGFAAIASFALSLTVRESMAIASGFGWYTLAPVILSEYSAEISAISFLHNVMREMVGMIIIPFVAKYVGYIEACSVMGAAAMDVGMPVIERATNSEITVYSFIMGVFLSTAVPILVPLCIGL